MRITLVFVRCGQLADFHTVFTFDNLGYIQGNIDRCMICLRNFLTAYPHCRAAFRMFDMSFFINVIHLHRNTFAIIFRFDRISFALANFFSGDIPSEFGGICHHTIAITDDSKEGFSHCRDTRFSIDVHCSRFIHRSRREVRIVHHLQGNVFGKRSTVIIGCRDLQCNRLLFGVIEVFACFQLQRTVGRYFKTFVAHRVGVRIRCILIRCAQFANGYPHFTFTDTDRIQRDISRCVIFIGRRNIRHILRITGRFFHSTYIVGVFDVDTDLMSGIVIGKRIGLVGRRRDRFPITQPLVPDTIFRKTVAITDFRCQFTADFGFTVNDYATRLIHRRLTVVVARIQAGTATFLIFGVVVRADRAAIF